MGEKTGISWTDSTYNPWQGCKPVSTDCDSCYARVQAERWGRDFSNVHRSAPATFNAPLLWQRRVEKGELPAGHKVFTCSISDFFIKEADLWREEAWEILLATPDLTYLILTKRPGRMAWWAQTHPWPSNVWAGVSVESAKYLPRLGVLARVPAKVIFASLEPLLGPVDLFEWLNIFALEARQWVIIGGESGPHHRPMKIEWVQDIVDECDAVGVPVFVKQASALRPGQQGNLPDSLWSRKEMPHA
jgi:protein gp37